MACALFDYTASRMSTANLTECLGEVSLTKKGIAMQSDEGERKSSYANAVLCCLGHDVEQQLWWCVARLRYLCSRV